MSNPKLLKGDVTAKRIEKIVKKLDKKVRQYNVSGIVLSENLANIKILKDKLYEKNIKVFGRKDLI